MAQNIKLNHDEKYINLALNLSQKNIGTTSENPCVGCVITIDNIIIATGVTSCGGRPHAEINAINKIADKKILSQATIYITLEPCSHFGKTSPCVDEIIKHKFERVVICCHDPNPKVNGNGIEKLRRAGIKTEFGIKSFEAKNINRGFFKIHNQIEKISGKNPKKIQEKIPFITIKVATSLDGKIATKNFQSKWISSELSRRFAHILRAKNQAIMVGAKTIIKDNPFLNCRINGLEQNSPTQIVISSNLNFSFEENFFTNLSVKKIILCSNNQKSNQKLLNWLDKNPNNSALYFDDFNNKIDLKNAFQSLAEMGINSILVEGGSSLITQLLKLNLVDELIWIRSNKIIGNDGIPAIQDLEINDFNNVINHLEKTKIFSLDQDTIEIFHPKDH
ncbi:MAG: bifunctional diaminohydroxyphosphoribosylaminopyrimidine deaminase/5-amino-6-(5-phosphoribosylamino)uracil reductase RibD [Proteobacteria bacterium]|nr:bifunctional diaminohydroxyphosphoribosylaminopyrimidine deaminase/5-amino-6-(5-phosphoribosylamino)uracil reductase RibD [Pseudomonadota bacterium]